MKMGRKVNGGPPLCLRTCWQAAGGRWAARRRRCWTQSCCGSGPRTTSRTGSTSACLSGPSPTSAVRRCTQARVLTVWAAGDAGTRTLGTWSSWKPAAWGGLWASGRWARVFLWALGRPRSLVSSGRAASRWSRLHGWIFNGKKKKIPFGAWIFYWLQ